MGRVEFGYADMMIRDRKEAAIKRGKKSFVDKELMALHGQVRRICIRCQVAVINKHLRYSIKMCKPCWEAEPFQKCPKCNEEFKSNFKRTQCYECHLKERGLSSDKMAETEFSGVGEETGSSEGSHEEL